jgi:guanosine-3',5'-bis(diphosphate) 3'-pyrophosphohydrolase
MDSKERDIIRREQALMGEVVSLEPIEKYLQRHDSHKTDALLSDITPTDLLGALVFAADKHSRQRRKDAVASPYINHPIAVAAVLAIEGEVTDRATLVAAILHDTVEDTKTTFQELSDQFGDDVSNLVREVTDDKSLDKAVRKQLQIEHAAKSSAKAKQIKLADRICNIRDILNSPPADWPLERRIEYLDWSCKVVSGCSGVNEKLDQAFDNALEQARAAIA